MNTSNLTGASGSVDLSVPGALARKDEFGLRAAYGVAAAVPTGGLLWSLGTLATSGWHLSGIPFIGLLLFSPMVAVLWPIWYESFGPYPTELTVSDGGLTFRFDNGSVWFSPWTPANRALIVWDYRQLPGKKPLVTLILVGPRLRKIPLNEEAMQLIVRQASLHGLSEVLETRNPGTAYQIIIHKFTPRPKAEHIGIATSA